MNTISTYILKQKTNFFKRFLLFFKRKDGLKFYELDENSWYDSEIDDDGNWFTWSFKEGIINLKNIDNISITLRDHIGRNLTIKCGNIEFKKKLSDNRLYIFNIECINQDKVYIIVDDTFSTVDDVRELGVQLRNIEI